MSEEIVIPIDMRLLKRDDGSVCFYQVLGIGHVVWADSLDADLLTAEREKSRNLEAKVAFSKKPAQIYDAMSFLLSVATSSWDMAKSENDIEGMDRHLKQISEIQNLRRQFKRVFKL